MKLKPAGLGVLSLGLLALVGACSSSNTTTVGPNDPSIVPLSSRIVAFLSAYGSYGADKGYDFLSLDVQARCSKERFAEGMRGSNLPGALRRIKEVRFRDGEAEVAMTLITQAGDVDQTWVLESSTKIWRIKEMPGLEQCTG